MLIVCVCPLSGYRIITLLCVGGAGNRAVFPVSSLVLTSLQLWRTVPRLNFGNWFIFLFLRRRRVSRFWIVKYLWLADFFSVIFSWCRKVWYKVSSNCQWNIEVRIFSSNLLLACNLRYIVTVLLVLRSLIDIIWKTRLLTFTMNLLLYCIHGINSWSFFSSHSASPIVIVTLSWLKSQSES